MQLPVKASAIADFLGMPLYGKDIDVYKVASLSNIQPNSLIFVKADKEEAIQYIAERDDVFVILPLDFSSKGLSCPRVFSKNPRLSFAMVVQRFFTRKREAAISSKAIISDSAIIGNDVSIGPYCIVEEAVVIGDGTEVRNNVLIKSGTKIGKNCVIRAFSVIGEEGFGFERDETQRLIRIPHMGNVRIGNDVEVGNFCTICRGTVDDTIIDDGVKIDDHSHIAHNVKIGKNAVITAGAVLAGSSELGEAAWIGPNSTVLNHCIISDGALIGIGSVVIRDVAENSHVLGNPAKRIK